MQHLQTHSLLDSISPRAAAAANKTLLQGEGGGTTKRFNQLLDAVQAASSEESAATDITGAEGADDTLQFLVGKPETPGAVTSGEDPTQSAGIQITPATPNALTTLVAIGENDATGEVSAAVTPAVSAAPGTAPTPELALGSAIASTKPVGEQPVTPQPAILQTSAQTLIVLPSAAPQTAAARAKTTVTPGQPAVSAPALAQGVTAVKDAQTPTAPTTELPGPAKAVTATLKQDVTRSGQPTQQVANTSSAVAEKLQVANLTPQAQTATPQAAATLGAATPVAALHPDGQRPQTTTVKAPAGVIQTSGQTKAVEQTVPSIRPAQPGEAQQNTLSGALDITVDAEAETAAAPKSVWQATKDAQPTFLTKPDAQGLAHEPKAGVVNDLPGALTRTPTEALQPLSTANKDLTSVSPAQAAVNKAPVSKPFSEALMMQVKAAEVVDGRTSVHLHPRGLGNIDVEIIAGDKDLASKVIVRVENPMILQHLRDDRHLLAQTIGVSDGTVFEFHERGAQQQGGQSSGGESAFSGTSQDGAETAAPVQHADILGDDRIDILT
ncbi:hypothetical protein [Sulfitobacter sp. JB4-11]|uniref:hypothetical protein n=1 Tax=Sulfitobacter rhodophyticola TaxID=3238304 RepID=UPI0035195F35